MHGVCRPFLRLFIPYRVRRGVRPLELSRHEPYHSPRHAAGARERLLKEAPTEQYTVEDILATSDELNG